MLINCPRCGFSQPNDQYCAQCGVDMQAYKPKSQPLLKKIFANTTTHVFLLLAAAVFAGQYIIRSDEPQRWVQKITRSQGVSKSKAHFQKDDEASQGSEKKSALADNYDSENQLDSLKNKELSIEADFEEPIQAVAPNQNATAATATVSTSGKLAAPRAGESLQDINTPTFRIIYAEVASDIISKWIAESSSQGQYQNLQDYSAGILTDFRKKIDSNMRVLKTSEKRLNLGQADTNFSGTMSDENNQLIGLAATIEYKSNDNGVVHGTIVVNRNNRQQREHFPAEFDLSKSAVFFMLGTLKRQSFPAEKADLTMPPFQIFKSPDFMTRKTEFVIIVEPEYK
jgi:hypothetical protein